MWFELNFLWLLTPAESYMGYKNIQSGPINLKKKQIRNLTLLFMDAMEKNHEQANSSEQGLKGIVMNYMGRKYFFKLWTNP